MSTTQLEQAIIRYTKGLPKETLEEILNFIAFMRQKNSLQKKGDNLATDLTYLNASETKHLEEEFKDYKKIYPRE